MLRLLMSKGWVLFLVVTVALSLAGAGYAAWTARLTLQGEVRTGSVAAVWDQQEDRQFVEVLDPATGELVPQPVPADKDVVECVSDLKPGSAAETVNFTVANAYPSYTCVIIMGGHIVGTIPVHISKIEATATDEAGNNVLHRELNVDVLLTKKIVDTASPTGFRCDRDTDLRVSSQLHPGDRFCAIVRLHAKQSAKMNHNYSATVGIDLIQWNLAGEQPGNAPVVGLTDVTAKAVGGTTTFPMATLLNVAGGGEQFTQMMVPGVESAVGEAGIPAVPVERYLVAIPVGADVSVSVGEPEVAQVLSVNLAPFQDTAVDQPPAQEPPTSEPPDPSTFADRPFVKNEEAYAQDALFPRNPVSFIPLGKMRDLDVGLLEVATAQYNPAKAELTIYSDVPWEVNFVGGEGAFLPERALSPFESSGPLYEGVLNSAILYEHVLPGLIEPICFGEELMILTHPDFKTAADALRAWKVAKGITANVFEVGTGTVRDTTGEIRDLIKQRYDECLVRPSYVLFMGDVEFIPTWYRSTGGSATTGTDTPYVYVAGGPFNILPDLAHGRIPVDTLAQAQTVVDKIIDYEQTPPLDASFYANASIASQFQCCEGTAPSGRDQRAFIEESEQTRNTLMGDGKTVERIYTQTGAGTPARYHDGSLLPADLGSGSGFPWNGSTQDIIDAFNDGRFMIIHRDHGWEDGWVNPSFTKTNVSNNLANGDLQPIVYSLNCASCFYDNESAAGDYGTVVNDSYFCERLLRKANGGAVGIIGDSRNSNTWSNTAFYRGLIDATWTDNDPAYGGASSIRRLGDIMNYAKEYTIMHIGLDFGPEGSDEVSVTNAVDTLWLYNVIGDPTLELWTSNPHLIVLPIKYNLRVMERELVVEYAADGATMTAYQDTEDGLVPIGRAMVEDGMAHIGLMNAPQPGEPILLSASMPNAVSVSLAPQALPDLMVDPTGPVSAAPGDDIGALLSVRVLNLGTAMAPGTIMPDGTVRDGGYMVDLVLSTDEVVPPGYATVSETFVEDALLVGGRISRTPDVAAGSAIFLSTAPPIYSDIGGVIPADTPPGNYFLCGRIDPGDAVVESNEANNVGCSSIVIGQPILQLPTFRVTQAGVPLADAEKLTEALGLPKIPLMDDGSLRFTDPETFQQVPTKLVGSEPSSDEENDEQVTLEAFDFGAISGIQVMADREALGRVREALGTITLAPETNGYGAKPAVDHTMFEAVDVEGTVLARAALDTQVNYRLQLGGLPVVGPGAKVKAVFEPNGAVSHLTYALRGLAEGEPVAIIPRSQADALARDAFAATIGAPPGDLAVDSFFDVFTELSVDMVYYAPPTDLTSVGLYLPWYRYEGTFRDAASGEEVQARRILIPAFDAPELLPVVDFAVSVEGAVVTGEATVTGGTSPYTYRWSSSSAFLDPEETNKATVSYSVPPGKTDPVIEVLTLVVTDANGVSAQASETVQVTVPTDLLVSKAPTIGGGDSASGGGVLASPSLVGGVKDVGTEWVGLSQGLAGSSGNANGFVTRFVLDNLWFGGNTTIRFNWGDYNAWERDFKDPAFGGNDTNWVDNVDAVFYTGHANANGWTFPGNMDDGFLHYNEARYGQNDLEWLVIAACGPLQLGTAPNRWWQRWGPAFQRLHLLGGYQTVTYDNTQEGYKWANYMLWGWTVRQAWMQTGIDVQGPNEIVAVMGVIGPNGWSNWNDHFWGEGSVGPDITDVRGYWMVYSHA